MATEVDDPAAAASYLIHNGDAMKNEVGTRMSRDAGRGKQRPDRGAWRAVEMVAANVTADEHATIQMNAKCGGYESIAAYLRAVALSPFPEYDTDAGRIARPLAEASYHLARSDVQKAQQVIADALVALRRQHDAEVRDSS